MPEPKKDTSNSIIKKVTIVLLILFVIVFGSYLFLKKAGVLGYLNMAGQLVSSKTSDIKSESGYVNVLILGKADKDHAGSDLTDTMIFSSISLSKPDVKLISIPRDIWIPEIRAKINSAYYWGNQKDEGGMSLAKTTVQNIVGVPIQYSVVIDFSGFKDVIDVLGGITVDVQNPFTDEKYPIEGRENDLCDGDKTYKCRYETIKFEKGQTQMDGTTALKFVRSRNAVGDEGTDIAREARQQLVINGVKNKVLSFEFLTNPSKISKLIEAVKSSIETDMDAKSVQVLIKKFVTGKFEIKSYLIPEDLLTHPPVTSKYDNQYVFIPKAGNGDWGQIHIWIKSLLP